MTVRETIPGQVALGRVRKLAEHNPKWDNKQCPPMISTSGYCFESLPWGTQWWAITWKCPADNTMVYNNTFSLLSGFDHSVHHRNRKHTKRSYNQQPMQMKNTSIDSTPQPRIQGQSHSAVTHQPTVSQQSGYKLCPAVSLSMPSWLLCQPLAPLGIFLEH